MKRMRRIKGKEEELEREVEEGKEWEEIIKKIEEMSGEEKGLMEEVMERNFREKLGKEREKMEKKEDKDKKIDEIMRILSKYMK